MKRAFTLIELLVVVGIMSFLGVAATAGYSALQRGMSERGATQAVTSLLRAARERALVDQVPTMVFCYNRLVREATADENAVVVGEAVAIRRSGRLSYVSGQYYFDEFADLGTSYDVVSKSDIQGRGGMKFWRFADKRMTKMEYSMVSDAVTSIDLSENQTFDDWTGEAERTELRNLNIYKNGGFKLSAYAFYDQQTSANPPQGGWKVGDGYGFEFATIRLPNNFIFGSSVPSQVGKPAYVESFFFEPDTSKTPSPNTIDIYLCRPDASGNPKAAKTKAGTADCTLSVN